MEWVLSGIRFLVLHILDILSGHAWLSFYHSYDYIHQYLAFVAGWTSCILGCYVSNEVIVSNIHRLSDDVLTSTTVFQNCLDNALDRCTCWIILYVDANAQQSSVWMVVLNISLYGCQCWTVLYVNVNANSALYGCTCEHCSMWMPILNNVLWRSQCRRMLCIGENAGQWLKKNDNGIWAHDIFRWPVRVSKTEKCKWEDITAGDLSKPSTQTWKKTNIGFIGHSNVSETLASTEKSGCKHTWYQHHMALTIKIRPTEEAM